jgi:U3 small nucleolar ribonucleoprotein protein IMP4
MTIITTSRKPVPELRSLAKDFAFATGCRYIIRGKMGLPDLNSLDPVAFLFSQQEGEFFLRVVDRGMSSAEFAIPSFTVQERENLLVRGFRVGDQSIYERLAPYIPVKLSEENRGLCVFDGTQSRRYLLRLFIHET